MNYCARFPSNTMTYFRYRNIWNLSFVLNRKRSTVIHKSEMAYILNWNSQFYYTVRDTNKCAYLGIFNDNFGHPIFTVILEHSQQKSFITDGKHMFLKPKDIIFTVLVHIVNIIPFSISHNARSIYTNKIHVLHNIVPHRKHVAMPCPHHCHCFGWNVEFFQQHRLTILIVQNASFCILSMLQFFTYLQHDGGRF